MTKHHGLRARGGQWHYRFELDGREYSGSTGLDAERRNVTAALAMMAEHRTAILEGRWDRRRVKARLFSDAWAEFLPWAQNEHRSHPRTAKRLRDSGWSLAEHFRQLAVAQISPADVERYKTWRTGEHHVRDITLRHDLHALSKFFGWAIRMGYARANPVREVAIPSGADAVRMHPLSSEEERRYFVAAARLRSDLHDIGRLMVLQGCRPDELFCLRWEDVDLAAAILRIPRGKSRAARRVLHLCAESRSLLAARMTARAEKLPVAQSEWVFPARRPSRHVQSVQRAHAAALAASSCCFVLYDLRHTFASRAAEHMPITDLAAILGHSSLACVVRYVHPSADNLRQAMARYDAAQQAAQAAAGGVQ